MLRNHLLTVTKIFFIILILYITVVHSILLTTSRFSESRDKLVCLCRALAMSRKKEYPGIFRVLTKELKRALALISSAKLQHEKAEVNTPNRVKMRYLSILPLCKSEPLIIFAVQRKKRTPPRWRIAVTAMIDTRHRGE